MVTQRKTSNILVPESARFQEYFPKISRQTQLLSGASLVLGLPERPKHEADTSNAFVNHELHPSHIKRRLSIQW